MEYTRSSREGPEFERAYQQVLDDFMTVIVFFAIVGVIGIFGNLLILKFYWKDTKQSINIFIIGLAITDLSVSCVAFVGIAESVLNIKLNSRIGCKLFYFFYYWCVGLSITLVSIIAFDRYRRICTPAKTQYAVSAVKKIFACAVLVWLMISLRAFLTVDLVTMKMTMSSGSTGQSNMGDTQYQSTDKPSAVTMTASVHVTTSLSNTLQDHAIISATEVSDSTFVKTVFRTKETLQSSFDTMTSATMSFTSLNSTHDATVVRDCTNATGSSLTDHVDLYVGICAFSKDPDLEGYVVVFHIGDLIYVSLIIIVIVFCYTNVIHTLMVHRKSTDWLRVDKKRRANITEDNAKDEQTQKMVTDKIAARTNCTNETSENAHETSNGITAVECITLEMETDLTSKSVTLSPNQKQEVSERIKSTNDEIKAKGQPMVVLANNPKKNKRRIYIRTSEIQTTIAMCVVSMALLLSFVPYFISAIYFQLLHVPVDGQELSGMVNLMIRFVFLNSSVNCFIYYIFSTAYRKFINKLLCPCCRHQ